MKKLLKIVGLMGGFTVGTSAFSGIAIVNTPKGQCYFLKNNQLIQKFECDIKENFGVFPMNQHYYDEVATYNFSLQNGKNSQVKIVESLPYGGQSAKYRQTQATLDGKPVKVKYRTPDLKLINKPQKSQVKFLTCLQELKAKFEFCFINKI